MHILKRYLDPLSWKKGDEVHLSLSIPALFLETHPHSSNNGRLAISRGPLIYCLKAVDHPGVDGHGQDDTAHFLS